MTSSPARRARVRRTLLWVCGGLALAVIAIVLAIVLPIVLHQDAGSSGQAHTEDDFSAEVTATGEDGRSRTLAAERPDGSAPDLTALRPGDDLVIYGSGFNANNGIYIGVCRIPDVAGEKPSPCLGGIPEGAVEGDLGTNPDGSEAPVFLESQWVTSNWAWRPFATGSYTDQENGAFTAHLKVPAATMEGLDCRTERCGIYTRNDHTAAGDRVQDLFLRITYAKE